MPDSACRQHPEHWAIGEGATVARAMRAATATDPRCNPTAIVTASGLVSGAGVVRPLPATPASQLRTSADARR